MVHEIEMQLYSIDLAKLVNVIITYDTEKDFMGCNEYGKEIITFSITDIKAHFNNGNFYKITSEDMGFWRGDIDLAISKHIQGIK